MPRPDVTANLIHFTKGADNNDAFEHLCSILDGRAIRGSGRLIKGGFVCVCFSEAPSQLLPNGLVSPDYYSQYSPFGVMVSKKWLYGRGGRPVIYQSDSEYDGLPEAMRWRHMRFEPAREEPIDFTWEREWRIRADTVRISPESAAVVVPDESWADRLRRRHEREQDYKVQMYSLILSDLLAEQYREDLPWRIVLLS
jgi:hypothetical protein